ncbi:MAG: hypothetical protein HN707_07295 [Verrucomicrobia bacterium]|nr:hypothetical protein [Verrucomicrobiota bacterium]MBT3912401.1 hypothetical protein [Verrucomicrobiota bacterium]MBT4900451.1 hypothetical protein [Verrucomicrobiota bacterium]MBT5311305.1 hypothetical protein [Verrucomicrobiota bacterium]MBT7027636.1 hypothetical protein [Verrucomicrobiota bacterium]
MERKTWLPLVLMLVFAASRWPGMLPQNFSAAHALLFCAAFWLPGWMGWVLPLATIIVTDILLNLFHYSMPVMVPELVVNWMILALFVVLAKWLAGRRSIGRVFLGTLIGALLFYLVSNTVSWMVNPAYAKTIVGWVQALTVGLPGFPPTWLFGLKSLLGTGLFTGLFAGAMKWSEAIDDAPEPETDDEEETEAPPEPSPEAA